MPRSKAVLFDLDDTLYPHRRFVLSGFAAVARALSASHDVCARRTFRMLVDAMRRGSRGRELQVCLEQHGLSPGLVTELVAVIRAHPPALRLPRASRRTLEALRPTWRIGVVTNGLPDVQARKVAALGLSAHVDTIVYAQEHGTGLGKPDVAPFHSALERLDVVPARAVFVGDDEACDIAGAAQAGLGTLLLQQGRGRKARTASAADVVLHRVTDVPSMAERLISRTSRETQQPMLR